MGEIVPAKSVRRPRFRRASEPPAFRLTEDDIVIVRQLARFRFLRSTHIASLVGRSLDRTNDRLMRLFHAGYLDRPHAQLEHFPTTGSAPMVYALADRGARLLVERDGAAFANVEWSRKNREAGRPFIDHQLGINDFRVALEEAARARGAMRVLDADDLVAAFPERSSTARNPFTFRATVSEHGQKHDVAVIPDFVFGLKFDDGSRRCFMVEIDRGTMPIVRTDIRQTSFARKMRVYLTGYAARQHERQFGWKAFRVLTVTTDDRRRQSMQDALAELHVPNSPGAGLFLFASVLELRNTDPLSLRWHDGAGRAMTIV